MSSKKDELIETAGNLFYRQGYGATGVKQIIDDAGIAKGTFYSHFDSKEAVGVAWLKKRHEEWNQSLAEATAKGRSPRAKLLILFDMLEGWLRANDFRGCAFLNSLAELPNPGSEMRDIIREHKSAIREHISQLAHSHFSDRSATYAQQKGDVIYLLFEAAIVESQNFRDSWPVAVARKEAKTLLQS